jgi:uncharacterized membrane protein
LARPLRKALNYTRSLGIGAVAGLRTFTAPAAVHATGESIWAGPLFFVAAGELVGDKLPMTPSRLSPGPFVARLVSGGWCGGELAVRADGARAIGIALGVAGAAAGAWLGYTIRASLGKRGLPPFALAMVEDAIAIAGARAATAN